MADSPEEVAFIADQMCGKRMKAPYEANDVFYNTGKHGFLCRSVYVLEKVNFE